MGPDDLARTERMRDAIKRVLREEFEIYVDAPLSSVDGAVATTALTTIIAEMLYRSARDHSRLERATVMVVGQLRRAWAIWERSGKTGAMH